MVLQPVFYMVLCGICILLCYVCLMVHVLLLLTFYFIVLHYNLLYGIALYFLCRVFSGISGYVGYFRVYTGILDIISFFGGSE